MQKRQRSGGEVSLCSQVETVSSKMTQATNTMKKMLAKKDRGKLCAILVLTLVLILLAYAVLAW